MGLANKHLVFAAVGMGGIVAFGGCQTGPTSMCGVPNVADCLVASRAPSVADLNPGRAPSDPLVHPIGLRHDLDMSPPVLRVDQEGLIAAGLDSEVAAFPTSQYSDDAFVFRFQLVEESPVPNADPRIALLCSGDCGLLARVSSGVSNGPLELESGQFEILFNEPAAGAWYGVADVTFTNATFTFDGQQQVLSGTTSTLYRNNLCTGHSWCSDAFAPALDAPPTLTEAEYLACGIGGESVCDDLIIE